MRTYRQKNKRPKRRNTSSFIRFATKIQLSSSRPHHQNKSRTNKMQIKVKCRCGECNCPEWAIVELQGVVEVQPHLNNLIQNLHIGVLCRPSSQESYTFTVGYHELTGTKVALKKPLLILKKIKHSAMEEEDNNDDNNSSRRIELDVIGIIKQRILFKTRPKALISRAEPVMKEKVAGLKYTESDPVE